jgi:tryptophan-rich sensory protein
MKNKFTTSCTIIWIMTGVALSIVLDRISFMPFRETMFLFCAISAFAIIFYPLYMEKEELEDKS